MRNTLEIKFLKWSKTAVMHPSIIYILSITLVLIRLGPIPAAVICIQFKVFIPNGKLLSCVALWGCRADGKLNVNLMNHKSYYNSSWGKHTVNAWTKVHANLYLLRYYKTTNASCIMLQIKIQGIKKVIGYVIWDKLISVPQFVPNHSTAKQCHWKPKMQTMDIAMTLGH